MQRILIIASIIIVVATSTMTAQWQVQQAPRLATMTSAHFVSADTGFAVGSSAGFLTTDGGLKWRDRAPLGNSIYFPTKSIGYCAGNYISKTTDGGVSWTNVRTHPEKDRAYISVHFIDDTIGMAVGNCFNASIGASDYDIVRTTDGGNQWTTVVFHPVGRLTGCPGPVLFRGVSRGYLAGFVYDWAKQAELWSSTDGGINWGPSSMAVSSAGVSFRIKSVCISDSKTMWVGGARVSNWGPSEMKNKRVFRAQNANDIWNEIWDTVSYVFPYTVNTITFADSLRGFIGDTAGNIYSTTDGGTTWKNDNVPSDGRSINSIAIAGGTRVFAVGDGGLILRYDLLVSVQESNTSPTLRLYPNPTSGRVRVDIGDAEPAVITVVDMMGRVQNITVVLDNELDVSMLLTGTYIVVVRRGSNVSTALLVRRNE